MSRPLRSARSLALAAVLALAGTALAQTGEQQGTPAVTVGGKVTAVDAAKQSITIEDPDKGAGTYEVDPKAMVKNGDKTLGLGDLKVGWWVSANGDQRGTLDAPKTVLTYIEVNDAP